MSLSIAEVMTKSPHTIGEDQTLEYAKHLMAEHGIRHLPVLAGGKCTGIISDRDIKLAFAVEPVRATKMKVSEACTTEVYSAHPKEPVSDVAKFMGKNFIGSAIIIENDKVVGIFTANDACNVLGNHLS